ncbi:GNAT family N-acetyltransferase [Litorivicinus lipolyticus]|uniref:GNAT family N-acetyltransferase n=1 Tax=Litorivicinus lipolyticus TaxID=418701 RepID=A0A5Q2QE24_9GAMM|nr:GNAT family N-acetyltransferase [Litorivicinus lipolyticus]QGG80276.1 GNAT family N-acetyltransferase [Litorivicinus lipolyticus]
MSLSIRDGLSADLRGIQAIYAREVLHGCASFEEIPPSIEDMRVRMDDIQAQGFPYLVAVVDGALAGFAYANRYRFRPAYRYTLENAIYVDPSHRRCGVGRALLGALIDGCTDARQLISVIGDSANEASIQLHQSLGFSHVGTLNSVGFKHGRWLDSVLMQRPLNGGDTHPP